MQNIKLCFLMCCLWTLSLTGLSAQPIDYVMECAVETAIQAPPEGNLLTICTDPEQIRYLRLAVHFLLPEQYFSEQIMDDACSEAMNDGFLYMGAGNFTETSDGFGNNNYNGYQRAEEIIIKANSELANNIDQWRKTPGESYPPTPPQNNIRYILSGVYFHRDDDAYYHTLTRNQIHAQYNIGGNEVLDVYHAPKDIFDGYASGFGGSNKYFFIRDYPIYIQPACQNWSLEFSSKVYNHEIGHTLSLHHTWNEDLPEACADTPLGFIYDRVTNNGGCIANQYANCYRFNPNIPGCPRKPCDEQHKITNNVMDYSEQFPRAYTQCQINRINTELAGNGNTYIHSCNGCMPSQAFFHMNKSYWICGNTSSVVLNGLASFNETIYLIEICEIVPGQPGNCISGTYHSTGWITGTVGRIELASFYNFLPDKSYKITLTVDNEDCPPSHTFERIIGTKGCPVPEPCVCFEMMLVNPFGNEFSLYYDATESGLLEVVLVNQITGQTTQLISPTQISAGS